jgi:hypothetical protein
MSTRKKIALEIILIPIIVAVIAGVIVLVMDRVTEPTEEPGLLITASTITPTVALIAGVFTDTLTATPTKTPAITSTPTETGTPIIGPTPTITTAPSETPTPFPLEFFDDFSDGVDPAWTVELGEYIIHEGKLTTTSQLFMTIGDDSWQNYTVEVEIDLAVPASVSRPNYISVRHTGNNRVAIAFDTGGGKLWESNDGTWSEKLVYYYSASSQRLRVIVQGANINAYIGPDKIISYVTSMDSGRVGLKIIAGTSIKSFKVIRIE